MLTISQPKNLIYDDAKEIYQKILDVYPFLTIQEKRDFLLKAKKIIESEKLFKKDRIGFLNKLLSFLKNPHAEVSIARKKTKKALSYHFQEHTIENGILYILIRTWSAVDKKKALERGQELINICLKNKKKFKGIIFDVRTNGGGYSCGAENLAGIFFKKDFVTAYLYRMENGKITKKPKVLKHNPQHYIDVPIVILIGKKCFSANEIFISSFLVGKRATLIGETTRGGSANPLMFDYMINRKKITVKIPTWRLFLKGANKPIEKTKIKPNIKYNKEDIVSFAKFFIANQIANL